MSKRPRRNHAAAFKAYEDIYLKAYGSMAEVKKGLAIYFKFYNEKRWHQNFDRKNPAMVYCNTLPQRQVVA